MTGTVFWITGLPGSGKTTIAEELCKRLREQNRIIIFLDGDILREIFGNDLGYDLTSRKKSADRNSRICKTLSSQGVDVVCATVSLFHTTQQWNRSNIPNYKEIYLKVSPETLNRRDKKNLYSQAAQGLVQNVIGVDLPFEEPQTPDLVIDNNGDFTPADLSQQILSRLNLKSKEEGAYETR